jgi:hypothetical protein
LGSAVVGREYSKAWRPGDYSCGESGRVRSAVVFRDDKRSSDADSSSILFGLNSFVWHIIPSKHLGPSS